MSSWSEHCALPLGESVGPGRLIVFCGVDGTGKSSLVAATAEWLAGQEVEHTLLVMPSPRMRSDPDFTTFLHSHDDIARAQIDPIALSLRVMADRLQTLRTEILPRLEQGQVIVLDRYVYTAFVDSAARGDGAAVLLEPIVQLFPAPHLAFYLDAPPDLSLQRIKSRSEESHRFLDEQLHIRMRDAFDRIAASNKLVRVSTTAPVDQVFARRIRPRLDAVLRAHDRS